jgi:BTB/POZ domain-containing protein KCTD9
MPTTIQVSGRRFLTDPATWVGESSFFKALFLEQWGELQDDGSYFIDADPDLFEYILHYLRRGVLPVFYDRAKGHGSFGSSHSLVEHRYAPTLYILQTMSLKFDY